MPRPGPKRKDDKLHNTINTKKKKTPKLTPAEREQITKERITANAEETLRMMQGFLGEQGVYDDDAEEEAPVSVFGPVEEDLGSALHGMGLRGDIEDERAIDDEFGGQPLDVERTFSSDGNSSSYAGILKDLRRIFSSATGYKKLKDAITGDEKEFRYWLRELMRMEFAEQNMKLKEELAEVKAQLKDSQKELEAYKKSMTGDAGVPATLVIVRGLEDDPDQKKKVAHAGPVDVEQVVGMLNFDDDKAKGTAEAGEFTGSLSGQAAPRAAWER